MTNQSPKALRISALVLAVVIVAGWVAYDSVSGPPVIEIINLSEQTLSDVSIHDRGKRAIGEIPKKSRVEFVQHVGGESNPTLSFMQNGRKFEKALGYIEERGGYCVTARVHPDMRIESTSGIVCFKLRRGLFRMRIE